MNLPMPPYPQGDAKEALRRLYAYLCQLVEALNLM